MQNTCFLQLPEYFSNISFVVVVVVENSHVLNIKQKNIHHKFHKNVTSLFFVRNFSIHSHSDSVCVCMSDSVICFTKLKSFFVYKEYVEIACKKCQLIINSWWGEKIARQKTMRVAFYILILKTHVRVSFRCSN